jgi:hypothetical protein
VRRDARRFVWRRWRDYFLFMTSFRVRGFGMDFFIANRRWGDHLLILGRRTLLLAVLCSRRVLPLWHSLPRLPACASE